MKLECPKCFACGEVTDIELRNNPMRKFCIFCGSTLRKFKSRKSPTTYRISDNVKRSRGQEKRAARTYRMRQQAASGATPNYKSDLREMGKRRGETKETTHRSFSLKLDELLKLESEARAGEKPMFLIEFQCVHPFKRYEVLPAGMLEALIAENEELKRKVQSGDTND